MVTLTDRARDYLKSVSNGDYVTLGVKGGGCSGFKYDFSFDNKSDENDLKYSQISQYIPAKKYKISKYL